MYSRMILKWNNINHLQLSDSNIILRILIYKHLHREGRTKDSDLNRSRHSLNIICYNFFSYVVHYIMIQRSLQCTYLVKFTLQPSFIQTYFSSQKGASLHFFAFQDFHLVCGNNRNSLYSALVEKYLGLQLMILNDEHKISITFMKMTKLLLLFHGNKSF
jgi:hypothetical protein